MPLKVLSTSVGLRNAVVAVIESCSTEEIEKANFNNVS